ncbi:MAG: ABC transporter permease [Armatimonadetes bacterium]|nr:ABC transporter permease [Anaerolineae bacterium]
MRGVLYRLFGLWCTVTVAFFMLRVLPGDAISAQLTEAGMSALQIDQRRAELGLDQAALVQYGVYWAMLLQGDWGVSLVRDLPVSLMIGDAWRSTLILAGSALLVSSGLGVALGFAAASASAIGALIARLWIGIALGAPLYWTGTLVIYAVASQLKWLSLSGDNTLSALILPVSLLSFHGAGAIARVTQTSIGARLSMEYVRTAHAKGLTLRRVWARHILPNSLIPIVTIIGLQAGYLFGGTVITETLFLRPGIGRVLIDATLRRDYPVVQAIVVVMALIYTVIQIGLDYLYPLIDPRLWSSEA